MNLKLFALFVKNKDVCVVYDQLKVDIWNNENLSNATISIQIGKLEKELQTKIPFLSIENIRGVGYHLVVSKSPSDKWRCISVFVFSNYQNDTTLPGKSD